MIGIPPVINVTDLNGSSGFRILGSSSLWEEVGSSVSIGDVNGDGLADLIVGRASIGRQRPPPHQKSRITNLNEESERRIIRSEDIV